MFPRLEITCTWKSPGHMEKRRAGRSDFGRMEKTCQQIGSKEGLFLSSFLQKRCEPELWAPERGSGALGCSVACGVTVGPMLAIRQDTEG